MRRRSRSRYAALMAEVAERDLERWPRGRPFALHPRVQAITLEVVLRAVFGVREEERLGELREAIHRFARTSNAVVWLPPLRRDLGPLTPLAPLRRRPEAGGRAGHDQIADRRAEPEPSHRADVLSLLLRARHQDGSPMSDRELRDELMTLLTAGHETTATALAWAFERLMRNGAGHERLEGDAEVDAVVKETLRVRGVARKVTRDVELAGYRIPAGTLVLAAIAVQHHRPDAYPEPYAFRPERFLEGQPEPYTWLPFGGGVRRCLGAAFAQLEMRVILRTILRRVDLRAADPRPERARVRYVTAVPGQGARAVLQERLASGAPRAPLGAAA
ncbi:MAG TPA: cytochrome P450 [Thermoleophilaceae bacterium]|nr:cytochrome P450 [Thermoleophilaceae bacterium]